MTFLLLAQQSDDELGAIYAYLRSLPPLPTQSSTVKIVGQEQPTPMALRVTHIYQRENGEWKLLHRHADPMMEKTAPGAVLNQ